MMNSSVVNTNSDISVNNTGINRLTTRDANLYHQNDQREDIDDRDMSLNNSFSCQRIRSASIESIESMGHEVHEAQEPSCSSAMASVEEPEPRAKKRRKQSNPVRYGQTAHQANILPMDIMDEDIPEEDNEDDDDQSLVAVGLRVSSELQRSVSFSSSDGLDDGADDEDIDDERSIELERRKLLQQSVTNVINFHSHKYPHFCPHCSSPFANDDELRSHIEEEHVQKLLERQLFHHQHHQQQLNNKSLLNGPNQLRPSHSDLSICKSYDKYEKFDQMQHKFNSSDSPSGSTSSGSNNNSPLQSPSGLTERKSFETNLPHGSSDTTTAKEYSSNFLPFPLPPNMPPLIPMSQPGGTSGSADGSKSGGQSTSPGAAPLSLALFPNPMAPFLFPMLPQHNNSGSNGSAIVNGSQQMGSGGVRIFNPEAYCELCNKEFCNKYFLKTHKANKHGIYSMDTLVGPPGYGSPFFPSGLSGNNNNNNGNPSAAAAAAAMQMQHLLQTSAGLTPTSEALVVSTQTVRSNIINMESYCEICQKEFCNKYFLKKHKQKIHGIADPLNQHQSSSASPGSCSNEPQNKANSPSPPLVNTSLSMSTSLPNSTTTCMSLVPVTTPVITMASSTTASPERQQLFQQNQHQQQQQTSSMVSSQNSSPTNQNYVCEICKQEFPNVLLLQTHRFTSHCPPTTLHAMMPNMSSAQLQTMAALSAGESPAVRSAIGAPAASLMDSGSFVFTPEKLREMGVINADAFCEICCKEFCNKYFLRTHKINKHGLSVDGTSSTKSQSGHISGDNKGEDSSNISNMSPNCNNDDSYLEPGQRDPASYANGGDFFNAIAGMHSELQCEICNRPFASHYLLKMHKFYSHNIPYIKEEDIRKSTASSPGASSEVPNDSTQKSVSETSSNINGQVVTQQMNAQNSSNGGQTGQMNESDSSPTQPNSDQASQDLLKLQTMIKELNSSTYLDKATCNLCRQEFENKYFLRVHMMNDHGVIPSDDTSHIDSNTFMRNFFDPTRTAFPLTQSSLQSGDSEAFCDICHKEFCSKYFLKTHKQNIHGIFEGPPTPTETTPSPFPQQTSPHQFLQQQQQQHRKSTDEAVNLAMSPNKNKPLMPVQPLQLISNKQLSQLPQLSQQSIQSSQMVNSDGKPRNITGRNYCNICNKELCNKYFMKTHMLKMHGINIDEHPVEAASNSTIGGVTCDICQKELCSKYFLKVHKQNTHGIYEEPPQPKEPRNLDSSMSNNSLGVNVNDRDSQAAHGIDPNDTNNRYFSHYTEVCPLCERRFKSIKWLKTHMINDHSDIVAMRPTDLSITGPNADLSRLCILCGQTFSDRVALHIHLVKDHRTTAEELGISGNISGMKLATTATDLSLKSDQTQQTPHSQQFPIVAQLTQHSNQQIPQQLRINGTTSTSPSPSLKTNIGIVSIPVQNSQITNNNSLNKIISIAPNITTTNALNNNTIILTSTPTTTITTISNPLNNININTNSNNDNNINTNNNNLNNTSISCSNINQVNSSVITCPTINTSNATSSLTSSTTTLVTNTITCPTSTVTVKEDLHRSPSTILSSSLSSIISKRTGCGTRIYHCSYCNYSTRWLSNLYAHEKRHTRLNTEADKKFVCRVCHRAYRYNHSLQRHLLNHRSSGLNMRDVNAIALLASTSSKGLLSSGTLHSTSDKLVELDAKFSRLLSSSSSHLNLHRSGLRPARVKRYRCSKCNKKFRTRDMCLAHIHALHSDSRKIILTSASGKMAGNKIFRCAYCGFTTRNYTILKIHINKNHNKMTSSTNDLNLMANKQPESPLNLRKSAEPPNSQALSLVTNKPESAPSPSGSSSSGSFNGSPSQTSGQLLPGVASQQQPQLPMTYAMPQSPPHAGSFIMQPFLITQPDSEGSIKNDTFVPSLVYLPVSHKVLQPVRVAFQLTPA